MASSQTNWQGRYSVLCKFPRTQSLHTRLHLKHGIVMPSFPRAEEWGGMCWFGRFLLLSQQKAALEDRGISATGYAACGGLGGGNTKIRAPFHMQLLWQCALCTRIRSVQKFSAKPCSAALRICAYSVHWINVHITIHRYGHMHSCSVHRLCVCA